MDLMDLLGKSIGVLEEQFNMRSILKSFKATFGF